MRAGLPIRGVDFSVGLELKLARKRKLRLATSNSKFLTLRCWRVACKSTFRSVIVCIMFHVRVSEISLLYGYSIIWFITEFTIPSIRWPKLTRIRNKNIFWHLPKWRAIMHSKEWALIRSRFGHLLGIVHAVCRQLGIINYIWYALTLLAITLELRAPLMQDFGLRVESGLSYKALYYIPMLNRIILIIAAILSISACPRDWLIYDKYNIFSLDYSQQIKYSLLAFSTGIPDALFDHGETLVYLNFLDDKRRYVWLQILHGFALPFESSLTPSTRPIARLLSYYILLNTLLMNSTRYKPIQKMIYASLCVHHHLRSIGEQMVANHHQQASSDKQSLKEHHYQVALDSMTSESTTREFGSSFSVRKCAMTFTSPQVFKSFSSSSDSGRSSSSGIGISSDQSQTGTSPSRRSSRRMTNDKMTEISLSRSFKHLEQSNKKRLHSGGGPDEKLFERSIYETKVISNLRQLEFHVKQLEFFVSDIDQYLANLVFIMILVNFLHLIVGAFFVLESFRRPSVLIRAISFCIARLFIPFCLFSCGNRLECEAKRVIADLELIYLENSSNSGSNSLLYKHYNSMMRSLLRIVDQLGRIRFACDNLMDINMGTMKKFLIYTLTAMFIVVQYGRLNPFG